MKDTANRVYYLFRWKPSEKWSLAHSYPPTSDNIKVIGLDNARAEQKRLNDEIRAQKKRKG